MKVKTVAVLLLMAALMLTIIPAVALADTGYTYIDENGETQTTGALTVTPITADTATLSTGWYVINDDVTRTASITVSGDVKLILVDGKTLTVTAVSGSKNAGINVTGANSLTIYGQADGTGTLNATGSEWGAGIGGSGSTSNIACGTITINGGTVNAYGGNYSAGIGSGGTADDGYSTNSGKITITSGTIKATGGEEGAGIGGGMYVSGGTITISGGNITATSENSGAGIGSGGTAGGNYSINGGDITITGGTIKATGGKYGAGIGGGIYASGGNITIKGGSVTATSTDNPWGGAGIGGGFGRSGDSITISGGTVVATGITCGAGIGGSGEGSAGVITISGGTVTASGARYRSDNEGSPGIGNGAYSSGVGTINLSGGVVFAQGGPKADDVGKGAISSGTSGTVTLEISNTAALFLKNNRYVTPTTTTQTHHTFSGHIANVAVYGIPVPWSGNFGAYLRLYTLSYDVNNGSGMVPQAVTRHMGTKIPVASGGGLRRVGYSISGWNTQADGNGSGYYMGDAIVLMGDTTLYAAWKQNTYEVIYYANDGTGRTVSSNHTYDVAKTLTLNSFAREGYAFAGWAKSAGGAVAYSDGESVINLTERNGAKVWLYAVWTPNTYTVDYNANGGSGSTDLSHHTYDVAKTLTPNSFTRTGYTFAGWARRADGAVIYRDGQSVLNLTPINDEKVTLYAVWTPHTYTVSYNANDGAGSTDASSHTYDKAKALTANRFTRVGYTFAGWAMEPGGNIVYADQDPVLNLTAENGARVTLYAVWMPHTYTVEYHANGGTGITKPSIHTYDMVRKLMAGGFSRVGYTFAGWALEPDGATAYADEAPVLNLTPEDGVTVTLYAVWAPHTYTVEYHANGGAGTTDSGIHTYDESRRLTPNGFSRVGYSFAGWSTEAEGTVVYTDGENVVNLTPEDGAAVTLYAVWSPHRYTVYYDANGGTGSTDSSSHTYDVVMSLTPNGFARTGHTFVGWSTQASGAAAYADEENAVNLTAEDGGEVTLYAIWRPNTYTIRYDANGGTGSASSRHTYGVAKPLMPNVLKRTGYTFIGWATSPGREVAYSDVQSVLNLTSEDDVTVMLYAVWMPNSYTVRYHANGGTGSTDASRHTYDAAQTLTANGFQRTGYTFVGWATRSNGAALYKNEERVSNLASEHDHTLTLYAVWKGNSYTVNYDPNGGVGNVASSRHTYGTEKALTDNGFRRTGYIFAGWATEAGGAVAYTDEESVVNLTTRYGAEVSLYAVWTPAYSLSVVGGAGGGSYAAGERVSIIADEAPPGQLFDKWISSGGGTFDNTSQATTTFTMPDQDVMVTATYRETEQPMTSDTSPDKLDPMSIKVDQTAKSMQISINMASLPVGTTAIKLPSGRIIPIDVNTSVFELQLSQDEWGETEQLIIVALNDEHVPLGGYAIDLSVEARQQAGSAGSKRGFMSVLIWIVAGVLAIGSVTAAALILLRKKK